jgi:superfamily II DNA or RNA helicase
MTATGSRPNAERRGPQAATGYGLQAPGPDMETGARECRTSRENSTASPLPPVGGMTRNCTRSDVRNDGGCRFRVQEEPRASQESRLLVKPGQMVRARGAIWRLRDVERHSDCAMLTLDPAGARPAPGPRVLLYPFDRIEPAQPPARQRVVSRRRAARNLLGLRLTAGFSGVLRALPQARIDLLPYQLEPALSLVQGVASRVLIADAVGLGKTIQAALVLAELEARRCLDHALILAPAGLRDQWAGELRDRFDLAAAVVDADWMRQARAQWPASLNPWKVPRIAIASLDFAKRPENRLALASVIWDLVIVDEAHAATRGTDRGAVVCSVASRARRLLMLTATPHSGDSGAFVRLCRVGAVAPNEPLALFRRTRRDSASFGRRHVHLLRVRPTPAEQTMHEVLRRYAARVWDCSTPGGQPGGRLAIAVLLKRACSSATSLARSVRRRQMGLREPSGQGLVQLSLPLDEEDREDEEPDHVLGLPGLADPAEEHGWLSRLLDAARAASVRESKPSAVARLLARTTEPVIIFTEFRDTLDHLARELASIATTALLHGGLDRSERRAVLRAFDSGTARVLLATDAGGEGLNLQSQCRCVVNLELPWNPIRLEQRIGRVDRIGQRRTVHATHLVAAATFEAGLLTRLAARVERAEHDLESTDDVQDAADDMAVADAIVRNTDPLAFASASPPAASHAEARIVRPNLREAAAVECGLAVEWRTLHHMAQTAGQAGPLHESAGVTEVAFLSRRRLLRSAARGSASDDKDIARSAGVICVFRAHAVDADGRLAEEFLIPVSGAGTISVPHSRAGRRQLVADLFARYGPGLLGCATESAKARLYARRSTRSPARTLAADRAAAMARLIQEATLAGRLRQHGLFDRRETVAAAVQEEARGDLVRALAVRASAADGLTELTLAGEPELCLAFVVGN